MSDNITITKVEHTIYPPTNRIDVTPFFSQPDACQEKLFQHRMLAKPLRQYVIENIKDPLRIALLKADSFLSLVVLFFVIVRSAWRIRGKIGKVTKENSVFVTTHLLLEHKEEFKRRCHLHGRKDMILSAYDIVTAENEHDPVYQFFLTWEGTKIAKDILAGKWPEYAEPPIDLKPYWNTEEVKGNV